MKTTTAAFDTANALMAAGDFEKALSAWDEVLAAPDEKKSRRTHSLRARALALGRLGRAEAFEAFCERIKAEVGHLAKPAMREVLLRAVETPEVARSAFNSWIERHASEPWTWSRPEDIWLETSRAWRVMSAFAKGWFDKAERDAQEGKLSHAIWAYERAVELWPELSEAAARMRAVNAQREAGGWGVMRHNRYAREDSFVAEFPTKALAEARLKDLQGTEEDHFWLVPMA